MIPLRINGKKYQIKTIQELTTREYIQLSKIENPSIIDYISIVTGKKFETIFTSKIEKPWLIQNAIGLVPNEENLKIPKWTKDYSIETIGQRYMIETHINKYKGYDLIIFVCAVARKQSMNIDDIEKEMQLLYNMPFLEVIPAARFFFHHLVRGKNSGCITSNWLVRLVRMILPKNRLV